MCLNSLADDKLTASVRCISPNGHLLEIGKYDILKGTALSMRPMHDNITFHGINLDSLFKGAQKEAVSASSHHPPLAPVQEQHTHAAPALRMCPKVTGLSLEPPTLAQVQRPSSGCCA